MTWHRLLNMGLILVLWAVTIVVINALAYGLKWLDRRFNTHGLVWAVPLVALLLVCLYVAAGQF